jgi:hypothetical protein
LVQLGHGLGLPGVGNASPALVLVSQRRSWPVPARRWPDGERAVARDVPGEEIET